MSVNVVKKKNNQINIQIWTTAASRWISIIQLDVTMREHLLSWTFHVRLMANVSAAHLD